MNTAAIKISIALGTLAVGGSGTYMTYDYLNKKEKSKNTPKEVNTNWQGTRETQKPNGAVAATPSGTPAA